MTKLTLLRAPAKVPAETTQKSEPAAGQSSTAAELPTEYSGRSPNFFSNVLVPAWMLVFGHDEVHARHRKLSPKNDED